jgi:hypothetical protein
MIPVIRLSPEEKRLAIIPEKGTEKGQGVNIL